jgi:hypothetical protein
MVYVDKEKERIWHLKNKERMSNYFKDYYIKNREKKKMQRKSYYSKNRIEILSKFRSMDRKKYWNNYYHKINKNKPLFLVKKRLRTRLRNAFINILNEKNQISSKYGIDYKGIIEHLKPFPKDISKYHIDHIKPLISFDLTDLEQIKIAFAPENHQWLLKEDNLRKGKLL